MEAYQPHDCQRREAAAQRKQEDFLSRRPYKED